ncbi:MAG: hypothetical protein ACO2ZM_06940 [Francisellaceae bacterium]
MSSEQEINIEKDDSSNRASELKKRKKIAIIAIIVIFCILVFELFIIMNQQSMLTQQRQLLTMNEQQTKNLQTDIKKLAAEVNQLDIKKFQAIVLNESSDLSAQIQAIKMQSDGIKQKLSALDNAISNISKGDKLSDNQLDKLINSLKPTDQKMAPENGSQNINAGNMMINNQYRIFSNDVNGTILQNQNGSYILATIGKNLPNLGAISTITEDTVIAGGQKIIANPAGFTLVNSTSPTQA